MKAQRDPEKKELERLSAVAPFEGARLLEIGCGRGQLTWQIAPLPRLTVGIDPDLSRLCEARNKGPLEVKRVSFIHSRGEKLPFSSHSFEIVLFASSL